jgi:toxic protein SymE
MAYKENRTLKVYEATEIRERNTLYGTRCVVTPQIRLQGRWLEELGFEPGKQLNVHCDEGKLTITVAE